MSELRSLIVRAIMDAFDQHGTDTSMGQMADEILSVVTPKIAEARQTALGEAISANYKMHPRYANTSVCYGGIGGSMVTAHCASICHNIAAHETHTADWMALHQEYYTKEAEAKKAEQKIVDVSPKDLFEAPPPGGDFFP